jgi:hypothetical protein
VFFLTLLAIHCCTVPNSTGRYAESGKFFKQEKTKGPQAPFCACKKAVLELLRRQRGDDFLEAGVAVQWVPKRQQF